MSSSNTAANRRGAPVVTELQVIPVAGHDSMLMNLSGAHGPFFTRNIVIVKDNAGNTGVGEVPGGDKIRQTLEDARRHAIDRMVQNATIMGANAIVRMQFDSSEIGNVMSEVVAYGTAVVVEPEG